MGHENAHGALKDIQTHSFWITFVVACILCILALVQRIRRRQIGRYAPPERQMDPQSFSCSPNEKRGGEQPAGVVGRGMPYSPGEDPLPSSYGVAGSPSACDILLPLSHSTQLPSSGYLAAVLGREQDSRAAQFYQQAQPPCVGAPFELDPRVTSRPSTAGTDTRRSSSSGSGGGGLLPSEGPGSCIETADRSAGSQMVGAQEFSGMSALDGARSVQKRSQVVQHLFDADGEGVRTYTRTMVEYS
ncbi:hypothetical protein BDV29DRAFT_76799 [Aspergillus leporis]|jgi:hypothetical protein|uniref:Uncharacterized protein n=1 Tax=Aspergillus leporis TaxID=41062 RepID=A0A5N5WIB0_9EURO|nr:hypothetical protein BDV29DRAFT_76799 [Aspergillus leporis]